MNLVRYLSMPHYAYFRNHFAPPGDVHIFALSRQFAYYPRLVRPAFDARVLLFMFSFFLLHCLEPRLGETEWETVI